MSASPKFVFKPAVLSQVNLIIGLAGGTGSGKTFSAMRLASGMSGGKRFAVIDTEAGRAKHYANRFAFDHGDLKPPFRPSAYAEAIFAADAAGYPVIVVDSCSHEWAGEGGILDWQEEELERMSGGDWKKREACKMAAWIKPKMDHKKMVQRLLQVRSHLILCFRAEEKVEMVRGANGKMEIVPKQTRTGLDGWIPVCEKSLPYELTSSFLLTADAPGIPKPIKLEEQHRALFPLDRPITEESGAQIAAWAAGAPSAPTVDEYDACSDAATLEELEKRRADNWRTTPAPLKVELKAASDAAAARLSRGAGEPRQAATAPQYDVPTAIKALEGATSSSTLHATWKAITADFRDTGRPMPLDIEAKFTELDEHFAEKEQPL